MALQFVEPKTVDLTVGVDLNANGTIAMDGETPAGQKTITVKGFKTAGTVDNAATVFEKILGDIGGTAYITSTAVKKLNIGVEEVE